MASSFVILVWEGESKVNIKGYEAQLAKIAQELIFYLMKAGATKDDAQDISQEAFVKLLETELLLPPDKMRAWMYRVAITRYYDLYSRKQRYQQLLAENFFTAPTWSDLVLPDSGLSTALAKLTTEEGLLILMRYEENLSIKEMARILHLKEGALKTQLFRIRQKLKTFLEEEN